VNAEAKSKLQFVEGIRGFAALIVVFQHLVLMFYPTLYTGDISTSHYSATLEHGISTTPLNILYNGNFAVCLFFVLSGFVLSYKYFKTNDTKVLIEYSVKRYFRLFFPIAFSILLVLALLAIFKPDFKSLESYTKAGEWLTGQFSDEINFLAVIYNMFIDVFANGNNKYNPVLWTMGIEFLGSLMLFASLMLMHRINKKEIVLVMIIAFLVFTKNYFYSAFFAGALICKMYVQQNETFKTNHPFDKLRAALLNFLLLVFGLYFGSYPTAWQYLESSIYSPLLVLKIDLMNFSLVLGSVLIILMVTKSKLAQKLFSLAPFRFLGKISFSNYLIHFIILITVCNLLFVQFISSMGYNKAFLMSTGISMLIILVFSWVVYKLVDQKSIALSDKITQKILNYLSLK
jgi:peptidoglycan/LPS O-acetylase OafA/YrhL